jgi:hypothetical protein
MVAGSGSRDRLACCRIVTSWAVRIARVVLAFAVSPPGAGRVQLQISQRG